MLGLVSAKRFRAGPDVLILQVPAGVAEVGAAVCRGFWPEHDAEPSLRRSGDLGHLVGCTDT